MVSDSINNGSITIVASKDFGKKKKANRSAKLKQCKLDARREQWLSQVKSKGGKEEAKEGRDGVSVPGAEIRNKSNPRCKGLDVSRSSEEIEGFVHHGSDSESPAYSPTCGTVSGDSFTGSSSIGSSSSYSFRSSRGSSSGSFSEDDVEGGGDDGCLDDWEVIADALAAASDDKQPKDSGKNVTREKHMTVGLENSLKMIVGTDEVKRAENKKSETVGSATIRVVNNRAWRPDDALRPQSLPNLSKQRSFPMSSDRLCSCGLIPWGPVPMPASCPICCEDLDFTDSSFNPCLCGFRLCLFCHKRILEEDGRCPGCRKPYDSNHVQKEASVSGRSLVIRLAHSCSMFSRS